jgi:hypothetical protein
MRECVCRLKLLLGLAGAVILRSKSRGTHDHILLSQIRDSPNLEGHVPVFITLRNRVARLYTQAPGSVFVASYDSRGYGGGIRPRLHTGFQSLFLLPLNSCEFPTNNSRMRLITLLCDSYARNRETATVTKQYLYAGERI